MKIRFTILLIVGVIVCASLLIFWRLSIIAGKTIVPSQPKKEEQYTTIEQKLDHQKPITLLFLGYAGGKHDGTYLTDSMMAVRIDPATKNVYLVSIPRDTWISIPAKDGTNSHWKINAAYQIGLDDKGYPNKLDEHKGQSGASQLVKNTVTQVIGQPVDNFVAIDFAGFKNTIDSLGGVDITVETTFDDYAYPLDSIPDESCGKSAEEIEKFTATVSAEPLLWEYFPCRYRHLHFDKGVTHMDGETALAYVRSRHSAQDGSDFGRAKRQRNLLLAFKQKILTPSFIPKAIPFIESLGNDMKTDVSLADMKAVFQHISELSSYQIHTYALTDKNFLNITTSSTGQSILAPKEGIDKWDKIHMWISDIFNGRPITTQAIVRVDNGTRVSGLAVKATEALQNLSIQTITPQSSSTKTPTTIMTVYDKSIKENELAIIMKEFSIASVIYGTHTSDDYNVQIVLGSDYSEKLDKRN